MVRKEGKKMKKKKKIANGETYNINNVENLN